MTTLNSDARRLNVKGLLIAVGLPVVLVGALVATLLGTGAFSRENQGEDGSLWLWTTPAGEIARVNGLTAATDARFEVTDAAGNAVQIVQTDTHLLLRNIATGQVSAIDLSTLALTGEAETVPGEGVRVALHDDGAFIVDQTQGLVNQVDPSTLEAIGGPLSFAAGLTGGAFDKEGKLWVGVPREGTIVQIEPRDSGAEALDTHVVAEPRQQLSLTVLGDGVAVLNSTVQKMTTLRSDGRMSESAIELLGPTETAETSPGTVAAVTVTDPPAVITVNDEDSRRFDIAAGSSNLLGASLEFHQRVYVPDGAAGLVWVYDLEGNELDKIEIDSAKGPIELYHTGDTLFANAVNTNNAVVVSSDGNARLAPKDRDDILGGNAPPEDDEDDSSGDEDEDEEGEGEGGEEVGPPGAVTNLAGTVGDGLINLSWDAAPNNGSALTKYVVEGAGQNWEIAPGQRVLEIDGLDNGEPYTFTVTAHNGIGAGDTATSPSITPSAEVPDPVENVEAVAVGDGTVDVTWDEADGQGNDVTGYQVEALSVSGGGDRRVVGQSDGTSLTVPDGELSYDAQYAFSVTTLAGAAASEPSALSNSIRPFNVPEPPTNLLAETASDAAGSIDVTWDQPQNNGRPIEKYIVRAGDQTKEVSGQTNARMEGFADGKQVTVTVTAVNEAGESEPAETTSNTMTAPQVQIASTSSTPTSVSVTVTYDDGGGEATCELHRGKGIVDDGPCDQTLTDGNRRASTEGSYQVQINNAVGMDLSDVRNISTTVIKADVYFHCEDPAGDSYCNGTDANRVSVRAGTSHDTKEIGATGPGKTYNAYCYKKGATITPRGPDSNGVHRDYHPKKKDSNIWVRVDFGGEAGYIPFVWLRVQGVGVNSTGDIPTC
ncbi:fibronectin type III domain-containing protein [Glycomyces sp. L485]|uniref:fibronectin type III domain-containing protein n=1 Tax=Glycomyces sp. L485 TaxID=2909235 RepID=UPI001F4A734B|nr:fibronectin type III domain-containing protein [Glycomyces sp. L485]MCH7231316.1 fibronectin type III domain-containing protein [Glycomyces sp. L485]